MSAERLLSRLTSGFSGPLLVFAAGLVFTACDDDTTATQTAADADSLVSTTDVAAGSDICPDGGSMYQWDLDDGAGGGEAGNGVLEAGEVLESEVACNTPGEIAMPGTIASSSTLDAGDENASFLYLKCLM